jgi:precorrin-2 dehydrogenase / sirohydrochlorin ferrochelatase
VSTTFGFPVALNVSGRRIIVIGAGAVRDGRVGSLLAAGADDVVVFADGPVDVRDVPLADPRVRLADRPWRADDLDGALLCLASSGDSGERSRIAREARMRHVLVNVTDDVANCDYAVPAVVRRGELAIAISTGGRAPALARRMRELLADRFGPEWDEIVRVVAAVRTETSAAIPELGERSRRWRAAFDVDEAERLVRAGRAQDLHDLLRGRLLGTGAA